LGLAPSVDDYKKYRRHLSSRENGNRKRKLVQITIAKLMETEKKL